jgi:hypothetical protein
MHSSENETYTRSSINDEKLPQKIEGMTLDQSGSAQEAIGQTPKGLPDDVLICTARRAP